MSTDLGFELESEDEPAEYTAATPKVTCTLVAYMGTDDAHMNITWDPPISRDCDEATGQSIRALFVGAARFFSSFKGLE